MCHAASLSKSITVIIKTGKSWCHSGNISKKSKVTDIRAQSEMPRTTLKSKGSKNNVDKNDASKMNKTSKSLKNI